MTDTQQDPDSFSHPAFFYESQQEYLDRLVPFITDGLDAGHAVLVAVPEPNLARVSEALGRCAATVAMTDMSTAGYNPGRILGQVLASFADRHRDQPVRMIGEPIWPGRSELEYPVCVQHEAMISAAFTGREVTVVCPYDAAHLDAGVLADASCTHPLIWQHGSDEHDSPGYAPEAVWARYNQPLPASATAVGYTVRRLADLSGVRAFAARFAQWFDLSADRAADLQLVINELATSALMQTGEPCRLALWRQDGYLVCEARDHGRLDDALTGRRPYHRDTSRGRGLYVVNAVADLVRTYTTVGQTTIHAYLRLQETS